MGSGTTLFHPERTAPEHFRENRKNPKQSASLWWPPHSWGLSASQAVGPPHLGRSFRRPPPGRLTREGHQEEAWLSSSSQTNSVVRNQGPIDRALHPGQTRQSGQGPGQHPGVRKRPSARSFTQKREELVHVSSPPAVWRGSLAAGPQSSWQRGGGGGLGWWTHSLAPPRIGRVSRQKPQLPALPWGGRKSMENLQGPG